MKLVIRLLSYLKIVLPLFIAGLTLLLLTTGSLQVAPLFVQHIIDQILTPATKGAPLDYGELFKWLSIYMGTSIIGSLVGYVSVRMLVHCANRIAEHLRNEAYQTMQNLPISYFDDKPAGKISARIVNDTETLRSQFYGSLLSNILVTVVSILSVYAIIFILNYKIGLALLVLFPVFYVWQRLWHYRTDKQLTLYYEMQSEVNTHVNEMMTGSAIIQLFKQEDDTIKRFDNVVEQMYQADVKMNKVHATISWSLVEVFKRTVFLAILTYVGYQFLGGYLTISAGLLLTYINYIDRLFNNMGGLVRMFPQLQRSLTTGRRLMELLDSPQEEKQDAQLVVSNGEVTFNHVTFGYDEKSPVLKDIHFTAKPGQTVALVGHTGSGKSSMINLLFRFYDPQQGDICIDGQPVAQYNRESVRQSMGIVLQDPYLFTGTIASNVAMDDETMSEETIIDALHKVGAGDLLKRLDKGIYEPVVEKGNAFSSGERQLISFARTLASNPKILILDEATSHIDTETEAIIQQAMAVVKEGRTTFIIAHRLSTIRDADQILVLHEGEIVERGTHQSLLELNGRYANMHKMQHTMG
ncbi:MULTISPECIES: ABC transporter ATP-binding protein [unclassified Facklamia]|uniref:ABC transporter ATP-binding protein n=1 Tax=Aerococcaceae TaxID=186827 RepID=UPI0013B94357|nr:MULTISPECIES: ABC transporter ATP-binding protein [unclassified Facklamia]NEW63548.1 ATP-binding cassette domain-containing protein [Facklamia sp. 252]NEW67019.1 ATP-binding cassette domain-containing protein [Facklamia sp. 253]QQD66432.1 ABC transporter ATP-binding protein [Aerococcaceae bacterium zg-252]